MTFDNAIFRKTDPAATQILGYEISPDWWSRLYEYPWAFGYAEPGMVVADMGSGWMERPFKRMLAQWGCKVYAVDREVPGEDVRWQEGITFVTADITQRIDIIPAHSLDRVFCISVLEDLADHVTLALLEFARLLKPDGLIVITADMQYDKARPLGKYPGIDPELMFAAAKEAGLKYSGSLYMPMPFDAVSHSVFNLCVFHYVFKVI